MIKSTSTRIFIDSSVRVNNAVSTNILCRYYIRLHIELHICSLLQYAHLRPRIKEVCLFIVHATHVHISVGFTDNSQFCLPVNSCFTIHFTAFVKSLLSKHVIVNNLFTKCERNPCFCSRRVRRTVFAFHSTCSDRSHKLSTSR